MTKETFVYGLNACSVTYHNGQKLYEHDELVKCFEDLGIFEQEPCDKCVYLTKNGCCQYDDITETIPPFEPCEDAISRQAVLKAIDAKAWEFCDYLISKGRNDEQKPVSHFADNLRECIREEIPPVKPQEPKTDVLDKIRDEIDRQEKWLLQAGYNTYNVDIALDAIKSVVAESEE